MGDSGFVYSVVVLLIVVAYAAHKTEKRRKKGAWAEHLRGRASRAGCRGIAGFVWENTGHERWSHGRRGPAFTNLTRPQLRTLECMVRQKSQANIDWLTTAWQEGKLG